MPIDDSECGKPYLQHQTLIQNQILGICPGNKLPLSSNPLLCGCPQGSIEALDDMCIMCSVEEVPNEDQTECVGMLR